MEINEIWTYTHPSPILTLEMGNINGNDEVELIATTKNGELLIFSLEGKMILKDMISDNQPLWHSRLFDLDGDGREEIILGGMNGSLYVFRYNSLNKLEIIWTHKFNSSISGILLEDTNDNGQVDVIAYSLDKTIRILNPIDGTMLWGQIFEDGIGDAYIFRDDKDLNKKQLIACGNDGTIRCFNIKNGELQWFKRYSDKMRCISSINSVNGHFIATGGDDKALHLINTANLKDVKSIVFNDYVWKLQSYLFNRNDKLFLSTYSFDYLNNTGSLEKFSFTSKLICFDSSLDILWELKGINIETLEIFEFKKVMYLLIGTTKGLILLVDGSSGKILQGLKNHSCTNMVKYLSIKQIIFSCHDNGSLSSFNLNYL